MNDSFYMPTSACLPVSLTWIRLREMCKCIYDSVFDAWEALACLTDAGLQRMIDKQYDRTMLSLLVNRDVWSMMVCDGISSDMSHTTPAKRRLFGSRRLSTHLPMHSISRSKGAKFLRHSTVGGG